MALADLTTIEALYLIKWIFGIALGLGVLVLVGAVVLDVRERRRWRAMVPDCWPPPGTLHDELQVTHRREVSS